MNTPQLMAITFIAVAATGCTRGETEEAARRTADEMRDAAVVAGDRLADGWLATKIQAQYFADEDVKARFINVSADEGVVTLRGRVDSAAAHEQAVQIARNTDGVRDVKDLLLVGAASEPAGDRRDDSSVATSGTVPPAPAIPPPVDDRRVTTSIQAKYFLDTTLKGRRIEVDTRQGIVTLSGEVASDTERAQALLLAQTTEGTDRVEDHLTVDASLAPAGTAGTDAAAPASRAAQSQDEALATDVESRLAADRQARGVTIEVTAKDGVVLLDGTAPNAAARQRAVTIARETPGVAQVVDRIRVGRSR